VSVIKRTGHETSPDITQPATDGSRDYRWVADVIELVLGKDAAVSAGPDTGTHGLTPSVGVVSTGARRPMSSRPVEGLVDCLGHDRAAIATDEADASRQARPTPGPHGRRSKTSSTGHRRALVERAATGVVVADHGRRGLRNPGRRNQLRGRGR
jgi:hypothetical protein